MRCDKQSFVKLVDKLKTHTIFQSNTNNKQEEVWIQLAVVLSKLGCDGNGVSRTRLAMNHGIGNGTVNLFTQRVFTAILSYEKEFIKWPTPEERDKISKYMDEKHGMPGCIGFVDGTPVVFYQRPGIDGEVYWTRKSQYAMTLMLWCNPDKSLKYYLIGWPGTVFDQTVFNY